VAVSDEPSAVGWRYLLWWMLAFLGFPLGGLLALELVGSVDGVVSGALGGALAGAMIGADQWSVLQRYLGVGTEWILALL
jgi:outer membrane lipoprotein SlyB